MKLNIIKKQCESKFKSAMNDINNKSNQIINESFAKYYAGGHPVSYKRTGNLQNANEVTAFIGSTSGVVEAGYNPSNINGSYSTGTPGYPVFEATANGFGGVVGNSNYDDEALKDVVDYAKSTFSKHFG